MMAGMKLMTLKFMGGMTDTLFTSPDFIEEEEKDNIWSFAPGQGNLPTSHI